MFRRISVLLLSLVMILFSMALSIKPASAAVLNWEAMVNSTLSGTRAPGWGDETNAYVSSMATFNGYLYAASFNSANGTEVWRTNNGTSWEQVNEDNFGFEHHPGYSTLVVFGNYLYAIRSQSAAFGVEAYRTSDGTTWEVAKNNIANPDMNANWAFSAVVYDGFLYVGMLNGDGEATVWASDDGENWVQVNVDNFGDANNDYIQALTVFNNWLYVGVRNDTTGAQVWYYDGNKWNEVVDDGFGSANNRAVGSLTVFKDQLYASTENAVSGPEVWRTNELGNWEQVNEDGFGEVPAVTNSFDGIVFDGFLYVGIQGGQVFRTSNGTTWEQVNEDGFGFQDNDIVSFGVLGTYLYAGVGTIEQPQTVEIYRYGFPPTPTELPETGSNNLNAYILDAIL